MILWIAGEYFATDEDPTVQWSVLGIFDSEDKARAACTEPHHFIGPQELNSVEPLGAQDWRGCYYPIPNYLEDPQ